ncbi:alpha/beta hydrolase [Streptomyces hiroshimensis]|uniref:Lipase/esterase n=1 Tax=Streptomyces hiroshimensis TaxID=66424 RepID=A0ABQ2Z8N2_9ACTN|nr:prolyl oligopeptidase family serine peptidase [Streptomyces hiroshimensis]GGY04850.1 putative lipase/esterase [Streptomyces hiroshimensis]
MTAEEDALFGLPYVPPDETVSYGAHPSQVVDFHLPAAPTGLRVTLLHGGFWREAYDRRHLAPLAAALAARGVEVALAEYRRVGGDGGGGWPQTLDDVIRAVGVRVRPGRPSRHVLVGHSAGGHLALCAAAGGHAAPPGVDAVVAVAPVADLARARELRLSGGAVDEFLGGARNDAPEADPVLRGPVHIPVTVLHGTADPDVPIALSRSYAAAAMRHPGSADVTLRILPGVGHYAPVTPGTVAYGTLLTALGAEAL